MKATEALTERERTWCLPETNEDFPRVLRHDESYPFVSFMSTVCNGLGNWTESSPLRQTASLAL